MLSPNSEVSLLIADLSEPRGKVLKHHGSKLNQQCTKDEHIMPFEFVSGAEVGVAAIKGL